MKFIEFAGEMINFGLASKIYMDLDGKAYTMANVLTFYDSNHLPDAVPPKSDTTRSTRYSVVVKMGGDRLVEYYDTVQQCKDRFNQLIGLAKYE